MICSLDTRLKGMKSCFYMLIEFDCGFLEFIQAVMKKCIHFTLHLFSTAI